MKRSSIFLRVVASCFLIAHLAACAALVSMDVTNGEEQLGQDIGIIVLSPFAIIVSALLKAVDLFLNNFDFALSRSGLTDIIIGSLVSNIIYEYYLRRWLAGVYGIWGILGILKSRHESD